MMGEVHQIRPAQERPVQHQPEVPIGDLVTDLWENTEKLVRQELELALAHLDVRVASVKRDATAAAIGGGVLYAGLLAMVAGVVLLLAEVMAPWLAALIVGAVACAGGYLLLSRSAAQAKEDVMPQSARQVKQQHEQHFFGEATK